MIDDFRDVTDAIARSGRFRQEAIERKKGRAVSGNELFLTVHIRSSSSGLPMNIWIGPRLLRPSVERYPAFIKVQMDHDVPFEAGRMAFLSVKDDPSQVLEGRLSADDLALVRRYIAINRQAILELWNERINSVELSTALKSVNAVGDRGGPIGGPNGGP